MSDPYEQLTVARQAVWLAIATHADTATLFTTKFDLEDEGNIIPDVGPSLADLDCIAIVPMGVVPKWFTNSVQGWPYALKIIIWTADWRIVNAERTVLKVATAIHSARLEGVSAPITKQWNPITGGGIGFKLDRVGPEGHQLKCVKTTLEVVLRTQFTPAAR